MSCLAGWLAPAVLPGAFGGEPNGLEIAQGDGEIFNEILRPHGQLANSKVHCSALLQWPLSGDLLHLLADMGPVILSS